MAPSMAGVGGAQRVRAPFFLAGAGPQTPDRRCSLFVAMETLINSEFPVAQGRATIFNVRKPLKM